MISFFIRQYPEYMYNNKVLCYLYDIQWVDTMNDERLCMKMGNKSNKYEKLLISFHWHNFELWRRVIKFRYEALAWNCINKIGRWSESTAKWIFSRNSIWVIMKQFHCDYYYYYYFFVHHFFFSSFFFQICILFYWLDTGYQISISMRTFLLPFSEHSFIREKKYIYVCTVYSVYTSNLHRHTLAQKKWVRIIINNN